MCYSIRDNLPFGWRHVLNVYLKEPSEKAQACVIWMHGLGADAKDMAGISDQLPLTVPVRHVFIDAPMRSVTLNNNMVMRAWYDIIGVRLTDREDREGIFESEKLIRTVIANQLKDGFKHNQIFLAGFSQGSAMALITGLRTSTPLGGIIALSGYLPLSTECEPVLNVNTPIFIAAGQLDQVVWCAWTKSSFNWLQARGFKHLTWFEYPMAHTLCNEEVNDLARWLSLQISSISTALES